MATIVNMGEAKSALSSLVKRAAAGEEILIAKNGKPLARLTRLQNPNSGSLFGAFAGKIHMADDFDQLPEEFAPYL
jgi:antitoxin (DNA-binding transcriptional repressor) of toxin-antitoxin stability system